MINSGTRSVPDTIPAAYTLLEVVLALALTTVILGLIGLAVNIHLRVADVSRAEVEEAQLARTLLQRIADDLRNATPYVPSPAGSGSASGSGSSGGSGSSAAAGGSGSSSAGSSSGSSAGSSSGGSDSTGTSDAVGGSYSGGIYGSDQELQVETIRRPKVNRLAPPTDDPTQPARLSDIRTVTYSLGAHGTDDPTERGVSADPLGGLYRRELDRAEFISASQQGQTDDLGHGTELLAPEVVNLQFTYYDGTTISDQWDSTQQGKLPSAVEVMISLRRPVPKSSFTVLASTEGRQPTVYDMLVDLPNSAVTAGQGTSQGSQSTVQSAAQSSPESGSPGRNSGPGSKPTKPKPTGPKPTKPTKPKPVKPVEPKPTKPTEPKPVRPVEPKPVRPVEPKPTKPTEPTPVKPVQPVKPITSIAPPKGGPSPGPSTGGGK
jgi:hypothetical protein